ncbi:DUF1827 family protein [Vagococcus silagei]|uniref:DUF1827 family protein n=1 Tax=Vagococcus silagei TaxID=2508885 RepID=A0A4S3B687_9ENTE|nr:DUF1827 family protein [Vagococcus silagei]THB62108.1 DUF1827 family protein [Vagococcus silagei]
MKLVDVTNSYRELVSKQLENTDASFVKVYSFGKTLVVHSEAPTHTEVVIINKLREVKDFEINHVVSSIFDTNIANPKISVLKTKGVVELSMLHTVKKA